VFHQALQDRDRRDDHEQDREDPADDAGLSLPMSMGRWPGRGQRDEARAMRRMRRLTCAARSQVVAAKMTWRHAAGVPSPAAAIK
jgi:hypothetical protein